MKLQGGILDAPLAIVDLETTGAHPVHDRITEIAVIEVEGGEVRSEWSTLVNPGTTIPPGIQALTGITNAIVSPELFEAERLRISTEPFLLVEGLVQRRHGTIHVRALHLERLPDLPLQTSASHDFA